MTASGADPLSYQWRFNGNPLADGTSSNLTIANAQISNEGRYSVDVSNQGGSVSSQNAFLYVLFPPVLSDPRIVSGGAFQMLLFGNTNRNYAVEIKTNLLDDWSFLKTVSYTNGQMPIIDSNNTNAPTRFYRTRLAQ